MGSECSASVLPKVFTSTTMQFKVPHTVLDFPAPSRRKMLQDVDYLLPPCVCRQTNDMVQIRMKSDSAKSELIVDMAAYRLEELMVTVEDGVVCVAGMRDEVDGDEIRPVRSVFQLY